MATELKKVEAPVINGDYGENIKTQFENIDDNFNIIGNSDLYKGDSGSSVISLSIPWELLLTGSSTFTFEGYTFNSCRDNVIQAFRNLINDTGETVNDNVNDIINQLQNSTDCVFVYFNTPDDPSNAITITHIQSYTVIDKRFCQMSESPERSRLIDMSCVIGINNTTSENTWTCIRAFPYLKYVEEDGEYNLYWCINNGTITIPAQGPRGYNGNDGDFLVGLTDTDLSTITSSIPVTITKINTQSGFMPAGSSGINIKDNTPIIILQDTVNPDDNKPYAVSNIFYSSGDNSYKASVGEENIFLISITDMYIKDSILKAKILEDEVDTEGVSTLNGYSIKNNESEDNGYSIFSRYDDSSKTSATLNIAYVDNIDNPEFPSQPDSNFSKMNIVADTTVYGDSTISGDTLITGDLQVYKNVNVGANNDANGVNSLVVGSNCEVGETAVAIGSHCVADSNCIAMGSHCVADSNCIAMGNNINAKAWGSYIPSVFTIGNNNREGFMFKFIHSNKEYYIIIDPEEIEDTSLDKRGILYNATGLHIPPAEYTGTVELCIYYKSNKNCYSEQEHITITSTGVSFDFVPVGPVVFSIGNESWFYNFSPTSLITHQNDNSMCFIDQHIVTHGLEQQIYREIPSSYTFINTNAVIYAPSSSGVKWVVKSIYPNATERSYSINHSDYYSVYKNIDGISLS